MTLERIPPHTLIIILYTTGRMFNNNNKPSLISILNIRFILVPCVSTNQANKIYFSCSCETNEIKCFVKKKDAHTEHYRSPTKSHTHALDVLQINGIPILSI